MSVVADPEVGFGLDDLADADFRAAVGPLFEGAPGFLARLSAARPFGPSEAMFDRALEIALTMPEADQRELIDAHPRLGAKPGEVSDFSFQEQGYERGDAPPGDDVAVELARLNDAYEERFGFRYCVFVAGRRRADLIPGFRAALEADPKAERERALRDVVAIARDRSVASGGSR